LSWKVKEKFRSESQEMNPIQQMDKMGYFLCATSRRHSLLCQYTWVQYHDFDMIRPMCARTGTYVIFLCRICMPILYDSIYTIWNCRQHTAVL